MLAVQLSHCMKRPFNVYAQHVSVCTWGLKLPSGGHGGTVFLTRVVESESRTDVDASNIAHARK